MPKKNVTIGNLADKIDKLEKNLDTLAVITKRGFERVDKRFDILEKRLDILKKQYEEIKLRLNNVPYRFEFLELQKRVEFLEKKMGIAK